MSKVECRMNSVPPAHSIESLFTLPLSLWMAGVDGDRLEKGYGCLRARHESLEVKTGLSAMLGIVHWDAPRGSCEGALCLQTDMQTQCLLPARF